MGMPQRCGIQKKEKIWGEDGELHLGHVEVQGLRDSQGPPGCSWVYKCGAQREVLPGERLMSSQHISGNEAMSLGNNIPMGESVYCEK